MSYSPCQENEKLNSVNTEERWPTIHQQPEYPQLQGFKPTHSQHETWYKSIGGKNPHGFHLLQGLLEYDPVKRLTAQKALEHKYFSDGAKMSLKLVPFI